MSITVEKIVALIKARGTQDSASNKRGNAIHRIHLDENRYIVDFAPDLVAGGWQQFDTDQDAWYFGVWVNPKLLLTLTYAEGDWILVTCADAEHYNAEVRDAINFYGEGFIAKAIDEHGNTETARQDREKFLIGVTT